MFTILNFTNEPKLTPIKFHIPYTWGAGKHWYVKGEGDITYHLLAFNKFDVQVISSRYVFLYEENYEDFRYAKQVTLV